jgi:AcrR family transcriptional regulator
MSELVASRGYARTTVAQITQRAHTSRTAFYEHFEDKEDCFIAAHAALAQSLIGEVRQTVDASDPSAAAQSAIGALAAFAEREPGAFCLLTHEAMLAGPRGWQAREELLEHLESAIEAAWAQADGGRAVPDIPAQLLVGATIRLLGLHMRRGERDHARLLSGLEEWIAMYLAPAQTRRWRKLRSCAALCEAEPELPAVPAAPQPLPKGRHRRDPAVVRAMQRERILHAAAEVVRSKRHADVSVAEIVAAAGVSRDVFYTHFHNKTEALLGAQALAYEQLIGVCTRVFYNSSATWPERFWETGEAFARFLGGSPTLSYLAFVESYALGPQGVKRIDDGAWAYSQFLHAGYRAIAPDIPPLVLEALICTLLEPIANQIRHDRAREVRGQMPVLYYMVMTPLLGRQAASELAERKIHEAEAARARRDGRVRAARAGDG